MGTARQSNSSTMSWQSIASAKRAALIEAIPFHWRIETSDIPSTSRLRDFGEYICRFLNPRELEITRAPSKTILVNLRSGEWGAADVTRAFCHRAAIAHQLVRIAATPAKSSFSSSRSLSNSGVAFRPIACRKYGFWLQRVTPRHSTSIFSRPVNRLDPYMAYLSASWIGSTLTGWRVRVAT